MLLIAMLVFLLLYTFEDVYVALPYVFLLPKQRNKGITSLCYKEVLSYQLIDHG